MQMSKENDELLALAKKGNEEARNELFLNLQGKLNAFALKCCKKAVYIKDGGDFDKAELYSDVFFVFLEAVKSFDPDAGTLFTSFFTTLFKHRHLDYHKKNAEAFRDLAQPEDSDEDEDNDGRTMYMDDENFLRIESADIFYKIRAELKTEKQKSILDLTMSCLEDGYISQSEVARDLGCSRQNVNIAYQTIRKTARKYISTAA